MKKIGKRKASLIGIVALALMVSVAVGLFMQHSGLAPKSYLAFALDSNPDSYGNMIWSVEVWQNKTGSFEYVTKIDYTDYITGATLEIDANYPTKLQVAVLLNKTLASTANEAETYTRVYLNISTVFTNQELGDETGVPLPSDPDHYWFVVSHSTEWTPATDTVYECTVEYAAYY